MDSGAQEPRALKITAHLPIRTGRARQITKNIDNRRPPEQAGLRPDLSAIDQLRALNQIIEEKNTSKGYRQYIIPFCLHSSTPKPVLRSAKRS